MKKIFLIFALVCSFPSFAYDVYAVSGVFVEVNGESGASAKNTAIIRAKGQAFRIVLARLLTVAESATAALPSDMDKMVRSFRLQDEKTTESLYSAVVFVQFDKRQVADYLSLLGLEPSNVAEGLPILVVADETVAAAANELAANREGNSLVSVKPYAAGAAERERIRRASLLELQELLIKQGASAAAVVDFVETSSGVALQLSDKTSGEIISFSSTGDLGADVLKALTRLGDIHKKLGSIAHESGAIAVLYVRDLADFIRKEALITGLSEVESVRVVALKYDRAQLAISHRYSLQALVAALKRAGLGVEDSGNYLVIK